jgi:hypothetical protein
MAAHFDLAAHFDRKDCRTAGLAVDDGHIPEWKPPGFIRTEARVCREQPVVVKLFGFPLVARRLRLLRALPISPSRLAFILA